jgi:tetratricopeptide (TPR) repeat protein
MWYSGLLMIMRRVDQAISEARLAQQLDPYSDEVNNMLALMLFFARQNDEIIVQAKKFLNVNLSGYWMGRAEEQKGNFDRAISLLQPPPNLKDFGSFDLAHVYAVAGRRKEALEELTKLTETCKKQFLSA